MVKVKKVKNEYLVRMNEKEFMAFNMLMEAMIRTNNEMEIANQLNN